MDFDAMKDKAEQAAEEHSDQVDKGVDKGDELAKEKFGHNEQVDDAAQKLKDEMPGGE